MSGRRVITVLVLAVLGWFTVGCGVTPQEHPQPLKESPTNGTSASPGRPTSTPAGRTVIYLLRAGRLLPVERPGREIPSALTALLTGPTSAELAAGVRTAIPATGTAISAEIDGPVARLKLPPEFTRLEGAQQALAVAQLVYTITELAPGVTGVRLLQGTRELPAPTVTGQLVSRPVTRDDYLPIAPN